MICRTEAEYFAKIKAFLRLKPDTVYVSTYGFYGIGWVRQFLDQLKSVKTVKILIGVPIKHQECASGKNKTVYKTVDYYKKIDWRYGSNIHMKCVGFKKNGKHLGCLIGGRNLSQSSFYDLSATAQSADLPKIYKHFMDKFTKAKKIQ